MSVELADHPFPSADGDVAIARQPIHDRWMRVVGYELLFRGASGRAGFDEERATASVIVETFTGLGVGVVVGRQPAHVRLSRRFLLELHAFALPADRVVLEVAAPDSADSAVRTVLERLAEQEYRISLACDPLGPLPDAPLAQLAHSIKLDVSSLSPDELGDAADRFGAATTNLIAAGVDTPALLKRCRDLGFHGFQGFFFCTPDVVRSHTPPTTRLAELHSLATLYSQTLSFEEFERVITRDVGLSYRLLCYLNSAFFNLPRHVASVREALMMLGMKAVRRWATLIALSGDEEKPNELTVTALLRGRLCELIGRRRPAATVGSDAFFTVGLFSVMDAIMDAPLDEVLEALPLNEEARVALLDRSGPMGDALAAIIAYERGDLREVEQRLPGLNMTELYIAALRWADAACGALDEEAETDAAAQESDDDGDDELTSIPA
ncbi:HDOD domain-containing protein [Conexibacter sp. JD483]|uniref:EAL and HDOD domain-containing protein n=1 Tax=unclassified Conexibacter TaxID=2627773 RepID=UPI00271830EC|nr:MULTISPECIES: HDOD domain-containing protein [unclassified Conexibacter]MDO8184633.1 HDOD domain-containing protein [Conexibacter sp. CPCC 205706]MDO8197939.1 HDOD domain-containing protein [Conexibacter sp. CPCC 205762]MDR9372877.1 HDOD domain-containing protein [Conexibacter sp. JD483]